MGGNIRGVGGSIGDVTGDELAEDCGLGVIGPPGDVDWTGDELAEDNGIGMKWRSRQGARRHK